LKWLEGSSWFLAWGLFSTSPTMCLRKFRHLQNKGTSLWTFFLKSGLRKFHHGISIVECAINLASRKVDAQSVINLAVVG